jgi:hypothetical protein
MTYCTGGIRCVKINAYLEQRLGFRNVHRLQGGIIAYARELESQSKPSSDITEVEVTLVAPSLPSSKDERNIAESRFKGVNYVFDERIGSRITDHVLTSCQLCGKKCDSYSNCQNGPCNVSAFLFPSILVVINPINQLFILSFSFLYRCASFSALLVKIATAAVALK